jgi:hypothetical protein
VCIGKRTSGLMDRDKGGDHMRDQLTLQRSRQGDRRGDHRLRWKPESERTWLHERLLAEGLSLLPGGEPRSPSAAPGKLASTSLGAPQSVTTSWAVGSDGHFQGQSRLHCPHPHRMPMSHSRAESAPAPLRLHGL